MSRGADVPPLATGGLSGAADDYVRHHNLATLMDAVLLQLARERPDDPMLWLAEKMRLEASLRRVNRSLAVVLPATKEAQRSMRHNPSLPH